MINHYETVFILTPVLSDIQMKETVRKFTSLLKDNNAVILNSEEWGLKKLAYPIAGKSTGFYVLVQFDAEASFVATLETEFRRDERIIRFLTTKLDKYALVYAEKRMKNRVSRINEAREESKKRYKERLVSSNSGENIIHNSENEEKQEHVSQILSKDEGEKQYQFIEKDNSQEENTSVNEN